MIFWNSIIDCKLALFIIIKYVQYIGEFQNLAIIKFSTLLLVRQSHRKQNNCFMFVVVNIYVQLYLFV